MGVRVGSHNTSVTSKLLWKNLQKSTFYTLLIQRGKLLAQLPHNRLFLSCCAPQNFLVMCQRKRSCEILLKNLTKTDRKRKTERPRWRIRAPHEGWWVLFTVVWLTLLRGYKLLLEQIWIPTQACGIQSGTLSVSGFDTAVWVPNASQTGT